MNCIECNECMMCGESTQPNQILCKSCQERVYERHEKFAVSVSKD